MVFKFVYYGNVLASLLLYNCIAFCPYGLFLSYVQAKMDQLKLMGPVILTGILKTLDNFPLLNAGLLFYACCGANSRIVLTNIVTFKIIIIVTCTQMLLLGTQDVFVFKL